MADNPWPFILASVGGGAFLRAMVAEMWRKHKAREGVKPIRLRRNRSGAYVPALTHVKLIERIWFWFLILFAAPLMLLGLVSRIIMGPP